MKYELCGSFIMSLIEMKLDQSTMFEWQQQSQDKSNVPYYVQVPDFINLRVQASEAPTHKSLKHSPKDPCESLKSAHPKILMGV